MCPCVFVFVCVRTYVLCVRANRQGGRVDTVNGVTVGAQGAGVGFPALVHELPDLVRGVCEAKWRGGASLCFCLSVVVSVICVSVFRSSVCLPVSVVCLCLSVSVSLAGREGGCNSLSVRETARAKSSARTWQNGRR